MKHYIIALLLALVVTSCGDDEPDKPDVPDAPEEVKRTVLVYMAANNSLGYVYDDRDIAEMEEAVAEGALNGGRLLIYHADLDGTCILSEVTEEGTVQIKEYTDGLSSVSIAAMRNVFADMREVAPADDYGLVLWSHASGWIDYGKSPEQKVSKSWGIDGSYQMSIPDLGKALEGERFSFIYFDCCFMGNIESLYEIRDAASFVVASPAETPLDGMPYDLNIKCFFEETPDLIVAAKNTFDCYNAMSGRSRSCTMAVYDMSHIEEVAWAVHCILHDNNVPLPGYVQQQYGTSSFRNCFFDLTYYMESLTGGDNRMDDYRSVMSKFVIYEAHTPNMSLLLPAIALNNCHGVSCYILEKSGDAVTIPGRYDDLQWWQDVIAPVFGF